MQNGTGASIINKHGENVNAVKQSVDTLHQPQLIEAAALLGQYHN